MNGPQNGGHGQRKVMAIRTPLNLAAQQLDDARTERDRATQEMPQLAKWGRAKTLLGPLFPGHMTTVGGRPGQGKTTLLINLYNMLVEARWPTLYIATETRAAELRTIWAAMRLGLTKKYVLSNDWDRLPADARERIRAEFEWQEGIADVGMFVDVPLLSVDNLRAVLKEYAIRCGFTIVILDHIHRLTVDDMRNQTGEMSRVVRGIKGSAAENGLNITVAAQLNRAPDRSPLADFLPAPTSALKQTGALEEESNIVLMLHRARKADATAKDIKEVAMGLRQVADIIEPGVMCANIGKHRDWPDSVGHMLRFRLDNERMVEELPNGAQLTFTPPEKRAREPGEENDNDLPF